jgi:cytochrome c oxidase assembly factor CtaG/putative copper export protein
VEAEELMADTKQRTRVSGLTHPDLPRQLSGTALVAGVLAVGLVALVIALLTGGGSPQPVVAGLPSSGAGTGWALPISRLLTDTAGIFTVGLLLAAALLLPTKNGRLTRSSVRLTAWASNVSVAWVVAAVAQIVLTLSDELGEPVSSALAPAELRSFVTQITQGRALLAQGLLAVVVAMTCRLLVTPSGSAVLMLVALTGMIVPAVSGHSGASSQHEVAVSSLMIHLVAASLWVGGLAGLVAVAFLDRRLLAVAVPRFSSLALWCFVALAASGAANAWIRLRAPLDLLTTGYGRLVLAKILLLGALGYAGWWHRRHSIPQLTGPRRSAAFVRLAAAELAVMFVAIGVAVALSRTPTPVLNPADLTGSSPARIVLGFDLPPAPAPLRLLLTQVRPDALFLGVVLLLAALYVVGLRRLHQRGDRWPLGRSVAWFSGLVLLTWATSGGLGTYSWVLFSAHMIQHMVLAMLVPVLFVLAAPTTLALRVLPARRGDPGPREWLVAVLGSRLVGFLSNPLIAAPIFVASFYALYFTSLFGTLMGSHWGHVAMQTHFLVSGYLFFWSLIGIDPGPRRLPFLGRLAVHLVVMPLHAFFNIAILSTTTLLAGDYFRSLHRPYLTDLLGDQHLGAGIGWAMGELPMLMVVVAIGVQWMRSDERDAARFDRQADRAAEAAAVSAATGAGSASATGAGGGTGGGTGGGAAAGPEDELAAYNRRLARLAQRDARDRESGLGTGRRPGGDS